MRQNLFETAGGRFLANARRRPNLSTLEAQANAKLDLPLGERRGERQRSTRRVGPPTCQCSTGANSVHVKSCEPRRKTKQRAYFVVYAGEVRSVGEVESLRGEQNIH